MLRSDIPINLPETFKEEARVLRNKLLLYRFHRRFEVKVDKDLLDPELEPRLNQILLPLLSVVSDPNLRSDLRSMARETQLSLVADRGLLASPGRIAPRQRGRQPAVLRAANGVRAATSPFATRHAPFAATSLRRQPICTVEDLLPAREPLFMSTVGLYIRAAELLRL